MSPESRAPVYSLPAWVPIAAAIAIAAGIVALVIGFAAAPLRTWLWLVVSFVLFGGIANGMLVWAAAFRTAQARWTPVVNRICQSAMAFVPFLALVLIALLAGARCYLPWTHEQMHGREAWFSVPFLTVRQVVSLGALWILSLLLTRWSLIADANAASREEISQQQHRRLNAISVAIVMVYSVAASLVAIDFIMGLAPEWVSTMMPPFYFCTSAYAALAVVVLVGASMLRPSTELRVDSGEPSHRELQPSHPEPQLSHPEQGRRTTEPSHPEQGRRMADYLKPQQFTDLGNLMLAFSLFNMGLFFAQYLTIWFENLPEETFFLLLRYVDAPWQWIGWASFVAAYSIPFLLLQSRHLKGQARLLSIVAVVALLGVSLERYVLVVPSLLPRTPFASPAGILIPIGFAGAFVLSIHWFLRRYPTVSAADEALREANKVEALSL